MIFPFMDLKSIRATPLKSINQLFKPTVHALSTERLLQELRNGCKDESSRGLYSEAIVAREFINKGWELKFHRHKFYGVELDLVFTLKKYVQILEVKSVSSYSNYWNHISYKQLDRLEYAVQMMRGSVDDVVLTIALVDRGGKVSYFPSGI